MTDEKAGDMILSSIAWEFLWGYRKLPECLPKVMLQSPTQIAQKGTDYSLKEHTYLETGSCTSHTGTL